MSVQGVGGEDAFDEAAAGVALGAVAGLAPADRVAQRLLGGVIGRLDASDVSESLDRRLDLEDFLARGGGLGARVGPAALQ